MILELYFLLLSGKTLWKMSTCISVFCILNIFQFDSLPYSGTHLAVHLSNNNNITGLKWKVLCNIFHIQGIPKDSNKWITCVQQSVNEAFRQGNIHCRPDFQRHVQYLCVSDLYKQNIQRKSPCNSQFCKQGLCAELFHWNYSLVVNAALDMKKHLIVGVISRGPRTPSLHHVHSRVIEVPKSSTWK